MGLFSFFTAKKTKAELEEYIETLLTAKQQQLNIKRHAIEHSIDIIAKTIAKSEIQVYRKNNLGKVEKSEDSQEYYKLNVQPNNNEEATSFFYKVIKKYLDEQEALIVCLDGSLYLADSFLVTNSILLPKEFYNVQISDSKGNSIILKRRFSSDEVIYLDLKCSKIKETLDDYYKDLGNLINVARNHYSMTNLHKFRLKNPGGQPTLRDPTTKKEISYEEYKNKITIIVPTIFLDIFVFLTTYSTAFSKIIDTIIAIKKGQKNTPHKRPININADIANNPNIFNVVFL